MSESDPASIEARIEAQRDQRLAATVGMVALRGLLLWWRRR